MNKYLQETAMLNFSAPGIQSLLQNKNWQELDNYNKILQIYNYIRDDISFGYNASDTLKASEVLQDGYGQCNTKGTLFMALLRATGIPCRLHGFTIDKSLQRGAMTGIVYKKAPQEIVHSWVEILYENQWLNLEGFILDIDYLSALQKLNPNCTGNFCGYGVATKNFHNPQVNWNGNNTYIQKDGIIQDFGIFTSPDEFYKKHRQKLSPLKHHLYQNIGRHLMNRNVNKIRKTQS